MRLATTSEPADTVNLSAAAPSKANSDISASVKRRDCWAPSVYDLDWGEALFASRLRSWTVKEAVVVPGLCTSTSVRQLAPLAPEACAPAGT